MVSVYKAYRQGDHPRPADRRVRSGDAGGAAAALICDQQRYPGGSRPDNFKIENLTPGINVFAMSFLTLMAGLLLAKDRGSSLLQRLLTTPLTAVDYIVGYMLPLIPIALMQGVVCYVICHDPRTVLHREYLSSAILISMLPALLFTALGLLARNPPQRKAGRWHLRRIGHEPHRMAVRRMVQPRYGRGRIQDDRSDPAFLPCGRDAEGDSSRRLQRDFHRGPYLGSTRLLRRTVRPRGRTVHIKNAREIILRT